MSKVIEKVKDTGKFFGYGPSEYGIPVVDGSSFIKTENYGNWFTTMINFYGNNKIF